MRHALGFDRRAINIFGFRIALHRWDGEISTDRHNHLRSFVGIPLRGTFMEVRYISTPGREWDVYKSEMSTSGSCVTGESRSTANLSPLRYRVRSPFQPYRCHHTDIHHIAPIGKGKHLSLCIFGRPQKESTLVYRKRNGVQV